MTSIELLHQIEAWLSFNTEPSCGETYKLMETIKQHIAEQKLNKHNISGKRPFECPNCHATLQEVEMTNREILDALKAACASGAVDKTVSDGCFCGSKDFVTRHMIRQCADCGRPV